MEFSGKTAMVTGAGRGIGEEIAKMFAAQGAAVAIIARTAADAERVASEIRASGGNALAAVCDVSVEEDVIQTVSTIEEAFGSVDILVNNAAVFRGGYLDELTLEDWHVPFQVTMDGTFLCCKHVLKGMKERHWGKIINIASAAISHPFKTYGAYAAAKSGLLGFGITLQEEVRGDGIHVNTVVLGLTNTADVRQRAALPPEEMLQPADVANVVTFLASDRARGFKGAALELFGDHV